MVLSLRLSSELAISLLANTICLTPGTVSARLSEDPPELLVHALDVKDPQVLIETIQARYEAPLLRSLSHVEHCPVRRTDPGRRGPGAQSLPPAARPQCPDRILALDTLYINTIALVVLLGIHWGSNLYFEAALLIALMGFVGTVALCKYLLRGDIIE